MEKMRQLYVVLLAHQHQILRGFSTVKKTLHFNKWLSFCRIRFLIYRFLIQFGKWNEIETEPVDASGRVQVLESGDLLISNVRENDAGYYQCVRMNEAGQVSGGAYLSVMGKNFTFLEHLEHNWSDFWF